MTSQADRAAAAVDDHWGDYLALLADLVRCPTMVGRVRPAQELLFRQLRRMGLAAELWDLDLGTLARAPDFAPVSRGYIGQPNVRGVLPAGGAGGRSLVLNGHIDVVSPEPVDWWTHDPWGATIAKGRMYGRGALDMKAGLIAALLALQGVIAAGVMLNGPVLFESVIDEECTGNGMLASRLRSGRVDGAVITEPTGQQVWTATPGVLWFEVAIRGRPSYVGKSGEYVNAIERAAALLHRLKPPAVAALNAAFDHPAFAGIENPLTLSAGTIAGGDWPSNVPLECRFTCRMSYPIGWTFEQAQAFVEDQVARAAASDPWLVEQPPQVGYPGFRARGWATDAGAPLVAELAACHESVTRGQLQRTVFPGTADARYFDPAAGEQVAYYGPSGGNIHAPDEYVELASILDVARVLARFIVQWCGAR